MPAAVFAAGGYILLAPDYLGLGQSHVMHPYLVASATTSAATDFLTAAYRVEADLKIRQNPDLYLTGFSEGGYAVAVVQRELESKAHPEVHLCAAASVSGAFDISSIAIPYAIEHDHSLYLSYLGTAYSTYYHQPLSSLFVERYASSLPALFDGDHQLNAIVAALPSNPRDLFVPEILRKLEAGGPNWFSDAAQQNQAFAWIPKAPLRLYFGSADTDVSPQEDRNFYDYAKPRGGAVVLEPLGPFQHTESAYHGIPKIRVWFDSLSN